MMCTIGRRRRYGAAWPLGAPECGITAFAASASPETSGATEGVRVDVERIVELRVHGVAGSPPQDLLDQPLVQQVAGDATAGYYRPLLPDQRRDPGGAYLEGYVWGGLTSGAPSRAFWLLLLPFTLVNVAPRLRPGSRAGEGGITVWLLWYASLLLALCQTMMLTLAAAGIGMDLLAWQCGQSPRPCRNASPGWLYGTVIGWDPQRRLAAGTLIPLAVMAVTWFVSSRSVMRYEAVEPAVDLPAQDAHPEVALASPWMWRGRYRVPRLRQLHLQAALAAVLVTAAWAIRPGWHWLLVAVGAAGLANCVVLPAIPAVVGHKPSPVWLARWIGLSWAVPTVAAGATAIALLIRHAPLVRTGSSPGDLSGLPRYAGTVFWLFAVQLGLVLALCVLVLLTRSRTDVGPRQGLRGLGTVVIAAAGVIVGTLFSAGGYVVAAAFFSTGSVKPHLREVTRVMRSFDVPEAIRDASLAYALSAVLVAVVLVLVVACGIWAGLTIRGSRWPLIGAEFAADYPGLPANSTRGKQVLRALWLGRLVDKAGLVLALLLLPGGAFSVWIIVTFIGGRGLGVSWLAHQADLLTGRAHGGWLLAQTGWRSAYQLQAVGGYLVAATVVVLIALGATAFRVPATRRSVGILWDLASFWPRAVHPLAAPCYAERTVPDLTVRVSWYLSGIDPTDYPTGSVILAGHSQGTVISAATLLQLAEADRAATAGSAATPHLAYLSVGCVLRRLYARYFRVYFGPEVLDELAALLQAGDELRWRNLWRHSDYLGGPVASGPAGTGPAATGTIVAADVELIDPDYPIPPGDTTYPRPNRHSNYWRDPAYGASVRQLAELLPPVTDRRLPPPAAIAGRRADG
jgi:hypothetical protein